MSDAFGTSDSTSITLLQRLRARDQEAWVRLTRIYGPLVYRWCRRAGVSSDDVADVVQEVFRGVAIGVDRFRRDQNGNSFRGWIFGITRHKVTDHFRRVAGGPRIVGGTTMQQRLAEVPEVDPLSNDAISSDQDQVLLLRQVLNHIRGEFNERNWQAFWRTTVAQENSAQVAAELGMTAGAVRQAKYRVLRRLRREMDNLSDE